MRSEIGSWSAATAAILLALTCTSQAARADDCRVWSTGLTFPPYVFTRDSGDKAVGTIGYFCIGDKTGIEIGITLSGGNSGDPLHRYMTNGKSRLRYNVYLNGDSSETFGDGIQGMRYTRYLPASASAVTKDGLKIGGTVTILGLVFRHQNVAAGSYSDNLVATITIDH